MHCLQYSVSKDCLAQKHLSCESPVESNQVRIQCEMISSSPLLCIESYHSLSKRNAIVTKYSMLQRSHKRDEQDGEISRPWPLAKDIGGVTSSGSSSGSQCQSITKCAAQEY